MGTVVTMNQKSILGILGLCVFLFLYLFVGFYADRESRVIHLFLKHRPYPKLLFASPLSEADRSNIPGKEGYLSPEQEKEETLYVEFVEHGKTTSSGP